MGLGVNEGGVCLEAMAYGDLDCFLLAGRYTLLEEDPFESLLPACEKRGISIIVGGPHNSGILAGKPSAGARYDYAPASRELLARAERLHRVCHGHGVPLPAAAPGSRSSTQPWPR